MLDRWISEFTTVKRAVIRSRFLRIPELIVTITLGIVIIGFEVIYKLEFLTSIPLMLSIRGMFFTTQTNWWSCWTYRGNCEYDLPNPSNVDYCTEAQWIPSWNSTSHRTGHIQAVVPCRLFDLSSDRMETANSLQISTRVVRASEVNDGIHGWQQAPGGLTQHALVGPEQMVVLHGNLPAGLGLRSIADLQGFIQYHDEKTARRIRCAAQQRWLEDCPGVPGGKYWSQRYTEVSGSDSIPKMTYNGTGCIQLLSHRLYCHLSELLRAAGIDLDKHGIGQSSLRITGVTLNVHVLLMNWDISDFWSWPVGLKPKFVIQVNGNSKGDGTQMYSSYKLISEDKRLRMDHWGVNVRISASTSWTQFDPWALIGILVVAMGGLKYANMFVTSVLVTVYKWLGCIHVHRLYEYHARRPSPHADQLARCNDAVEFLRHHQLADEEHLKRLFVPEVELGSEGMSSCSSQSS